MNDGDRIFIQPGNGIGDLIMLTPVLRELKKKFPRCIITVMSSDSALKAIRGLYYIDDICSIKDKKEIMKKMSHQDYVIFFDYKPLLFALAKLLCVQHRIGPCKEKYKKFKLCTKYFPYQEHIQGQYQSDFYLNHLCKALNLQLFHYEYKTDVFVSKQAECRVGLASVVYHEHK